MRRLRRPHTAALLALLALFGTSERAAALVPCAHHHGASTAPADAPPVQDAHADHTAHGADDAPAPADHAEHDACTCVGACGISAAQAAPVGSVTALATAPVIAVMLPDAALAAPARRTPHQLPWATAPPAFR